MKRFLFGFLAIFFLLFNVIPYFHIMADDMPTDSQYEMLGAFALSSLITSGEATELDFSDYTENDTSFLIDLGEAIFTGDWSGLAEDGLEWLGETADSVYDSYKEYISQWKSEHLGIMYSNWFPDETIYVGPDDSYSLAKPLRQLFTPSSNQPDVNPDPDFSFITHINQLYVRGYNGKPNTSLFDFTTNDSYRLGFSPFAVVTPQRNFIECSYMNPDFTGHRYNDSTLSNNALEVTCYYPVITISLYTISENNISVIYSNTTGFDMFNLSDIRNNFNYGSISQYLNSVAVGGGNWQIYPYTERNQFDSKSVAINYIFQHFANVNLYVDGVPWALVGNYEPNYPITIPGSLTIYNGVPIQYSLPTGTHIDLPDLTNIIRSAINSSGVVMWSDIADTYVDINGQTAVAVTNIIRNDYDNLYNEQYPYPAMLIGMTENTQFNEHLLDDSHGYLSPMVDVVQETVGVLPSEILGVLSIGAILTIFAVIINRLLE